MQWNNISEFFAMGGYALYVWGSFGITLTVVAIEVLLVNHQRKEIQKNLRDEFQSETVRS
jgi:heme exporter protein D